MCQYYVGVSSVLILVEINGLCVNTLYECQVYLFLAEFEVLRVNTLSRVSSLLAEINVLHVNVLSES